jgi:tetratricopeptide (TPR) repeat protein
MVLNIWLEQLGDSQIDKGNINDALQSYQKALALNSESVEIHQKLSNIYNRLGQIQLAQKHQLKALMLQSSLGQKLSYCSNVDLKKSPVDKSKLYNYRIKSPNLKLLYFEIPKNASSTIKTILFSVENQYKYDPRYTKYMWYKKWQKRFPQMIVNWQEITTLPYLKFAFIRNPYERIFSGYLNTAWQFSYQNTSFERFVDSLAERIQTPCEDLFNNHYKPFSYFVPKAGANFLVDFIGKVENCEKDLKTIFYACGLKSSFKIPKINKTKKQDYRSYYTTKAKLKIFQIYEEDIELGKYLF